MSLKEFVFSALDNYKKADFEVKATMKLGVLCDLFKKNFGLTLRIYKGRVLADGRMSINTLDQKTSLAINVAAEKMTIKATQKVGEVEEAFKNHFGLTVQIANGANSKLVDNDLTLGQASRLKD